MSDDAYTRQLEYAVRFALLHLENPPGLSFKQRTPAAVRDQLRRVLAGKSVFDEYDLTPRSQAIRAWKEQHSG